MGRAHLLPLVITMAKSKVRDAQDKKAVVPEGARGMAL